MTSKSQGHFSSRNYFTLQFIPFVSATQESKDDNVIEKQNSSLNTNLSGKEASDFYKSIISTPSSAQSIKISPPQPKKPIKKTQQITYNPAKIHTFAQNGDLKALENIIKNTKATMINSLDAYGWTPVMCAVCEGHLDTVKYLLDNGADLSIKNSQGKTALDIAKEKEHFDIVDLLKNGVKLCNIECANKTDLKEKFCKDCDSTFKEPKTSHERSISHLFSTEKGEPMTFYHIPENNKGFQMMVKSGWDQSKGLGSKDKGRKFPIKTVLKEDRSCIGRKKEVARVTHFSAYDYSAVKRTNSPGVKVVREKTFKKWQRVKQERKHRQKEIDFRRQFHCDF